MKSQTGHNFLCRLFVRIMLRVLVKDYSLNDTSITSSECLFERFAIVDAETIIHTNSKAALILIKSSTK